MTKVEYSDERRTFLKTVALLGGATLCLPLTKVPSQLSSRIFRPVTHLS